MTEDKGILIRNIYYMLAYAFQELRQNTQIFLFFPLCKRTFC